MLREDMAGYRVTLAELEWLRAVFKAWQSEMPVELRHEWLGRIAHLERVLRALLHHTETD